MAHGDAHLWTAGAYFVIGLILIGLAFAVWFTHPVNRVFVFGPYLTERGMHVVMRSWPLVALFGAFIFSCAVDHAVEWLMMHGRPELHGALTFFSVIEAVISWFTALVMIWLGGRALVRASWRK